MAIQHSRNALVHVGQGDSPETFVVIDKQTDFNLALNAGRIDVANKTTQNWAESLADLREFTIRGSNFINFPDTTGWDTLRANAVAGTDDSYRALINSTPNYYQITGQVQDFEITGPNRNATGSNWTIGLSQGVPAFT